MAAPASGPAPARRRGGRRPGAGRPQAYREPLRRVSVALPLSYIEQLRRYGQDNLSEGIRRLVEEARTPWGHFWYILPDWARQPDRPSAPAPGPPPEPTPRTEAAME